MSATTARPDGHARAASRLATLLALAVFINYVDRGNLATAAPVIKTELHLSASQIGILLSAFFWTYAISQLAAGWLAERFPVHRVVAAGFALWSVATILTGAATGFATLLCLRLLLGLDRMGARPPDAKGCDAQPRL
jgi:sugar phosphate permease